MTRLLFLLLIVLVYGCGEGTSNTTLKSDSTSLNATSPSAVIVDSSGDSEIKADTTGMGIAR